MNPISLELNLTMAQAHARPRVRDKGFWKAVARYTGEDSRKKTHTRRGRLFVSIFICNDAMLLRSLDFLSFSFLLYLGKYMLSKSQPATVSHVVEPTTQGHPGDKAEGRDLG